MPVSTGVKLSTLSYAILYVKNVAKSVPFYRDTLGIKVKMESPDWVEFETGATTLALHAEEKLASHKDPHGVTMCFSVDDLIGTYESLKQSGIKFSSEPKAVCEPFGDQVPSCAEFEDLDGNKLSIYGMLPAKK
jgi:lactoylglutathione lyase